MSALPGELSLFTTCLVYPLHMHWIASLFLTPLSKCENLKTDEPVETKHPTLRQSKWVHNYQKHTAKRIKTSRKKFLKQGLICRHTQPMMSLTSGVIFFAFTCPAVIGRHLPIPFPSTCVTVPLWHVRTVRTGAPVPTPKVPRCCPAALLGALGRAQPPVPQPHGILGWKAVVFLFH